MTRDGSGFWTETSIGGGYLSPQWASFFLALQVILDHLNPTLREIGWQPPSSPTSMGGIG